MKQIARSDLAILDQLAAAIVITDRAGTIIRWNRAATALYGWTEEEALGQSVVELLVPASERGTAVGMVELVGTGEPVHGEVELLRKDGTTVQVQAGDVLIHDETGAAAGIVGMSFDITERKWTERRLAVQYAVAQALSAGHTVPEIAKQILKAIGESVRWEVAALWRVDEGAGVLQCVAVWHGSEVTGAFEEVTRRQRFSRGIGLPGRVWATGQPAWIEDVVLDPNFPRSSEAERAGLHGAFGFPILLGDQVLGVIEAFSPKIERPDEKLLDMTRAIGRQIGQFIERMDAEAAVRATDARRKAILEASLDGIVAMDHEGRVTEFNPAAQRIFGYTREEALGQDMAELLIPPSLRPRHREGLRRYLETGEGPILGERIELPGMRKDGTEFRAEIAVTRVDLPGPAMFKGAIRDVTEQRRAEEERDRLLAAERAARHETEAARERLAFLIEANTLLASSLDFAAALGALGRLAVSLLADLCLIDILMDDGTIRRMVAVHADPRMQPLTDQLGGEHAPAPDGPHPAVEVMRSGKSVYSDVMTDEFLRETTRNDDHYRVTRELGFQSYICVPLVARGRVLGTITLVSTSESRRYGPNDVAVAEDLARRTAITVDNARLYEAEQRTREAAERAAERMAILQSVTSGLSEALTPEDVADVIVERATEGLRASAGALALVAAGGTDLELIRWRGYAPSRMEPFARFGIDDAYPLSEAVRTLRPVLVRTQDDLAARYPTLPPREAQNRGLACVPLVVEGRAIGGLALSFAQDMEFGEDDEDLLLALGRLGAQAIERARAYDAERRARDEAESAERRLGFLANASAVLAASVTDYEATLQHVARLAVPEFADWCVVDLAVDGSIQRVALAHADPEKEEFGRRLTERYPPNPSDPSGVAYVLRTGQSEIFPEVTEELLAAAPNVDAELLEIVRGLGLRSTMTVPLVARGRTLGAMTFVTAESGRSYGPPDLRLAEDLARRAGLAVDNARLYHERSYVARTLQQTLLPPKLPSIPGVELGALYRPAGEGAEIGGDFYDLFETADGTWALAIGDVCGKGADAAAVIGLVRYSLRAVAMQERRPSRVLSAVNEALRQQTLNDRFCTAAYARLRSADSGVRITICCAGHPLPIVLRNDGSIERVGQPGTLLGVFPDPELTDRVADLGPGDAVIFFTDGVTEERSGDQVFGEEGLTSVVASCVGLDADAIASAVGRAVMEFRHEPPRDDMAIVVLRIKP